MTRLSASTCLMFLLACLATADLKPSSEVTVIFNFKGPHSGRATREMQREASFILKEADVNLSWRPLAGAFNDTYTRHTKGSASSSARDRDFYLLSPARKNVYGGIVVPIPRRAATAPVNQPSCAGAASAAAPRAKSIYGDP
jgi:hypothetical protein